MTVTWPDLQPERRGIVRAIDLIDAADLEKMISGAERTELLAPARICLRRHRVRIGHLQLAALLGVIDVRLRRVTFALRPFEAVGGHSLQLSRRERGDRALGTDAGGNRGVDGIGKMLGAPDDIVVIAAWCESDARRN